MIGSLATHARGNEFGFIETPFYKVQDGRVLKDEAPLYMTADEEDDLRVAPGDIATDERGPDSGRNGAGSVSPGLYYNCVRRSGLRGGFPRCRLCSVATSLIPFIEHDDANRAFDGF